MLYSAHMSTIITIHCIISGRVQGVWYRAWTQNQAANRDLTGWVRNRRDGSVEAVFHGPAQGVADVITACRSGPPLARVDDIIETPVEPYSGGMTFDKRDTE